MKTTILTTAMLFCVLAFSQNELTVKINRLKSDEGKVMISLMDEKGKVVQQTSQTIEGKNCTVTFNNLPSGTYAIQYFHDENSNEELDTGMFGIPKEGYGFSNDARGMMGPPDLEEMLFSLQSDKSVSLTTVN